MTPVPGGARMSEGIRARMGRASGSATVWLLVSTWVVWSGLALVVVFAGAFGSHQRARSAADMAALAAVSAQGQGGDSCAEARRVAEGNGADLVSCRVLALPPRGQVASVEVVTRVPLPGALALLPDAEARARAGRS